jgi:hypothetical protein
MPEFYQVRPGDTAAGIARALTGDARRFVELGPLNPRRSLDVLFAGEKLELPPSWHRARTPPSIGAVLASGMTLEEARRRTPWLSSGFFVRVGEMAKKYGFDPYALLVVMDYESGVHPYANPDRRSGANGLIHWMPENVPRGMSMEQLTQKTADEQLVYVDEWIGSFHRQMKGAPLDTPGKVYALVFCPGRLSPTCNESTIAFKQGVHGRNYTDNANLDVLPPKGVITFADLSEIVRRRSEAAGFAKFAVRMRLEGQVAPIEADALVARKGSVAPSRGFVAFGVLAGLAVAGGLAYASTR